jgi:hypothetical protein
VATGAPHLEDRSFMTYSEVYEGNCEHFNRDVNAPIFCFKSYCLVTSSLCCRAVNQAMARFPEARRRLLQLHTPIILAVWPQARLVQEERSFTTYSEVYEGNCERFNRDVDAPILHFKDHVHGNLPQNRKRALVP